MNTSKTLNVLAVERLVKVALTLLERNNLDNNLKKR
jgi:hypothetical protein